MDEKEVQESQRKDYRPLSSVSTKRQKKLILHCLLPKWKRPPSSSIIHHHRHRFNKVKTQDDYETTERATNVLQPATISVLLPPAIFLLNQGASTIFVTKDSVHNTNHQRN
ncbi:hypothetical protein NPIL_331321 [Nephila pilipes]|uniref:Uncharacterized protein n=1 Tax=Nephila pilipes TaxID=299642 RepID=A0A8X6T8C5_NEPPI|nr:hypothetical protein NPIL_331321 [Nephila pilipes]